MLFIQPVGITSWRSPATAQPRLGAAPVRRRLFSQGAADDTPSIHPGIRSRRGAVPGLPGMRVVEQNSHRRRIASDGPRAPAQKDDGSNASVSRWIELVEAAREWLGRKADDRCRSRKRLNRRYKTARTKVFSRRNANAQTSK